MRIVRSERGAALITALLLTMLSLVIALTLLYVVSAGTKISASQRRYRTALAAAHGGVELFTQEIMPQLLQSGGLENGLSQIALKLPGDCLQQKLTLATANWSDSCRAQATSDPSQFPDAVFKLSSYRAAERGFNVSTKIIDAVPGNSDKSSIDYLDAGGGVSARDEVIHPRHVPGIYSIAVQGVREGADSREKAQLSVLYAY